MSAVTILGPVGSSVIELPFFSSRVSAGFPSPAQDHMEQTLSLDELLDIDAPHTYLVRAEGDSMTGAGILDGDVMVVSRALTGRHGDVVIAAINGETFVKRLIIRAAQQGLESIFREGFAYAKAEIMLMDTPAGRVHRRLVCRSAARCSRKGDERAG